VNEFITYIFTSENGLGDANLEFIGLFTDFGSGVENHYSLLCYPSGGAGAAMSPRVAVF